nr:uncharacterized protein LOC113828617 [Penaeus vannamei]
MAEGKSTQLNPLEALTKAFKQTTEEGKMSGRAMKYPYTLSAKIAQFPFSYYVKNQWVFKYYLLGVAVSIPVFSWFQKQACSPANKAKWEAKAQEGH